MDLAALVDALTDAVDAVREDLRLQYPNVRPELVRDTSGRYVLVDALAAVAVAQAALIRST